MGTALTVYEKVENPVLFCKEMSIACASIVGCTPEQGSAIALTCLIEGLTPIEFIRRYHWIPGKGPSMRSDAMLAEFRINHGGKSRQIEKTADSAEIELTDSDGNTYRCRLTRRQALLSRWPWAKNPGWKEGTQKVRQLVGEGVSDEQIAVEVQSMLKEGWATDLDWKNMLWARLVSESLHSICPEVVAGIYTPEELEDIDDLPLTLSQKSKATSPAKTASEAMALSATREASGEMAAEQVAEVKKITSGEKQQQEVPVEAEQVVDADFEIADEPDTQEGFATRAQLDKLQSLRIETGLSKEKWDAALSARNAQSAHNLTSDQAQEIIDKLENARRHLSEKN